MDSPSLTKHALRASLTLAARAATTTSSSSTTTTRPAIYKVIGICLAVCSGLFIGVSFVLKKVGLLRSNVKYNQEAGEGYGYLKNAYWWTGMTLMIIGEICNFVAYAFTDAILVTPLGALSVVVTTALSAVFLKERLSFVGKVACLICILGSVVIVLNAPEQSAVADIQEMQHYVISAGFLSYAGVIIVACIVIIFFVAPKYGKKSMLVHLSVCSLIGGLSVVATQGLGSAILAQADGKSQFNHWFLYVLFVFVVTTLLTEIVFLNKALNLFNAALVTPTYYVYFTSCTIVTSAVLFQGFHGTATQIVDVVLGFLIICSGVILLQLAKSSKDVPDTQVLRGDLDQVRTVAEQEEPEYEPRADTIRGGAGIVRALSRVRTQRQIEEVKRLHEERMMPIGEGEEYEWDGLRRRKTVSTVHSGTVVRRQKTVHPPLGMTHFPDDISEPDSELHPGFFGRIGRRNTRAASRHTVALDELSIAPDKLAPDSHTDGASDQRSYSDPRTLRPVGGQIMDDTAYRSPGLSSAGAGAHIHFAGEVQHGGARTTSPANISFSPHASPSISGPGAARRQFSFQNVFHRHNSGSQDGRPSSRGAMSFISHSSGGRAYPASAGHGATEEERLGLVHGDSAKAMSSRYAQLAEEPEHEAAEAAAAERHDDSDDWQVTSGTVSSSSPENISYGAATGGDLAFQQQRSQFDDDDDDLYDQSMIDEANGLGETRSGAFI